MTKHNKLLSKYEAILNKEFGEVDKPKQVGRSTYTDKLYKKFNPSKGVGVSTKGLRVVPLDIVNMSVWD